jgi:uncharacterized protein
LFLQFGWGVASLRCHELNCTSGILKRIQGCDEMRGFKRQWRAGPNEWDAKLQPMRLVIDTNTLLSIYLYRDARHTPLRAAYAQGCEDVLLMDALCYEELAHVLRHRQFEKVRQQHGIETEPLLIAIADECEWISSAVPQGMPALPVCRDPDDQKFLLLAARGKADALVSYDKAVLKCRGRVPFTVARPEELARLRLKTEGR